MTRAKIRISRGLAVNKNIMLGFFQIKKKCQFSCHKIFSKVNTKSTFYNSRHRFQLNNLMKAFTMLSSNFDLINSLTTSGPAIVVLTLLECLLLLPSTLPLYFKFFFEFWIWMSISHRQPKPTYFGILLLAGQIVKLIVNQLVFKDEKLRQVVGHA